MIAPFLAPLPFEPAGAQKLKPAFPPGGGFLVGKSKPVVFHGALDQSILAQSIISLNTLALLIQGHGAEGGEPGSGKIAHDASPLFRNFRPLAFRVRKTCCERETQAAISSSPEHPVPLIAGAH